MTTTHAIISALTDLTTDFVSVVAVVRDGRRLVVSYTALTDDLGDAEGWGAQVSSEIGAILKPAGFEFVDSGADDPGIYESWRLPVAA